MFIFIGGLLWIAFSHLIPTQSVSESVSDGGGAVDLQTPPQYSSGASAINLAPSPINLTYNLGTGNPTSEVTVPSILPVQIPGVINSTVINNSPPISATANQGGSCSGGCDSCSKYSQNKYVRGNAILLNISQASIDAQAENLTSAQTYFGKSQVYGGSSAPVATASKGA